MSCGIKPGCTRYMCHNIIVDFISKGKTPLLYKNWKGGLVTQYDVHYTHNKLYMLS